MPELRAKFIASLMRQLEDSASNMGELTALVICSLLGLDAIESLSIIKRTFDANAVEEIITGDFEDAEISLGLKVERAHLRNPSQWTRMGEFFQMKTPFVTGHRFAGFSPLQKSVEMTPVK